jgi:hypothetical protein
MIRIFGIWPVVSVRTAESFKMPSFPRKRESYGTRLHGLLPCPSHYTKVHAGLTEVSSRRNLISSLAPLVDKVLFARVLLLSPSLKSFNIYHLRFRICLSVIPAQVGIYRHGVIAALDAAIQVMKDSLRDLDSGFRRNDGGKSGRRRGCAGMTRRGAPV